MAHVISTSPAFAPFAAIRSFVENAREAFAQRAEYNRTFTELNSLSRRELEDIGVARCDIADIARVHVYG